MAETRAQSEAPHATTPLHDDLRQGIAETQALLDHYHQAYPWLHDVDWEAWEAQGAPQSDAGAR